MILKSVISFRKVGEEVLDYLKCRNKEASYSIEQVADRIGKAFNKFVISSGRTLRTLRSLQNYGDFQALWESWVNLNSGSRVSKKRCTPHAWGRSDAECSLNYPLVGSLANVRLVTALSAGERRARINPSSLQLCSWSTGRVIIAEGVPTTLAIAFSGALSLSARKPWRLIVPS